MVKNVLVPRGPPPGKKRIPGSGYKRRGERLIAGLLAGGTLGHYQKSQPRLHRPTWSKSLLVAKGIILRKMKKDKTLPARRLKVVKGAKKAAKEGAKEGAKKAEKKEKKVVKQKTPAERIAARKAKRATLKAAKVAVKAKDAAKKEAKKKAKEAKKAKKAADPKVEKTEKKKEEKSPDAKKVAQKGKKTVPGKKGKKKPFTVNKYGKKVLRGVAKYGTRGRLPGTRLHVRGLVLGYRRGRHSQSPNQSLVKIEGVNCRRDAKWYLGKRVAYVYAAQRKIKGTRIRVVWGKVCRPHGKRGVVRARFRNNLPPKSAGRACRIMLFPSRI
jgi:large subunit ribosomal protein L35Ae